MRVIGLMSGTSGDGVDAALVDIRGRGDRLHVSPLAFATHPYPPRLRERLLRASMQGTVQEICHLNVLLGELLARAALRVVQAARLRPEDVELIGSHGHTVQHLPRPVREPGIGLLRSTLQIGEASVIAERTGVATVSNFRARDMALGGEGAPLAPYAHQILFRHPRSVRLIVNVGGISNVTYVPARSREAPVLAFDTGPGNMLLDAIVHRVSGGRDRMDRNGRRAGRGQVDADLLTELLRHPFLRRTPPKSTGREEFGDVLLLHVLEMARRRRLTTNDLLATCTRFTAEAVGLARRWLPSRIDEVIVGGGGARNPALMRHLASVFDPVPVLTFDAAGWESKAFEAIAFAVLAYQTLHGQPANVPSATGAERAAVLGTVTPGRHPRPWML